MEWGLSRYDAFVPAFPDDEQCAPFPRSKAPHVPYIRILGIDPCVFIINDVIYPATGDVPLSSSAHYVVISEQHARLAERIAEPSLQITSIEKFLPGVTLPDKSLSAEAQVTWLKTNLAYLTDELKCEPGIFPSAQRAWRFKGMRRMGRDWKEFNTAQNGFWFTLHHAPICEAFMLSEYRDDRQVVTCDIRSAYGWAIGTQVYPAPNTWRKADEAPAEGVPYIALCRLSNPTEWLSRHHPWQYTEKGINHPFYWKQTDTVAGWFAHFELDAVRGICDIEIIEVRVPEQSGQHPLASQVKTWIDMRAGAPAEYAQAWKIKVASSHTWTVRYAVDTVAPERVEMLSAERLVSRKFDSSTRVQYERFVEGLGWVVFLHNGPETGVWLPAVWTALLVRTRVFSIMRWAHDQHPNAQCAYVNVDSVHWSVPRPEKDAFCSELQTRWGGTAPGAIRIEHIGDGGVWLRPGAYVLVEKNRIIQSTMGDRPWNQARSSQRFWERNWQTYFSISGKNEHAYYLRPQTLLTWTEPQKILTRQMVAFTRWKIAVWLRFEQKFMCR